MKRFLSTVLAVLLVITVGAGCTSRSKAHQETAKETEQAFSQQRAAVPYPLEQLKDSLERRNVRDRLLRTNVASKLGYVYIINFGKIIGYYAIKGKVSSTQSQMTTAQLFDKGCSSCDFQVTDAPGDDGTYGPNEDGVFFFTTEGAFVETSLDWLYADQPLPVDVPRLNSQEDQ